MVHTYILIFEHFDITKAVTPDTEMAGKKFHTF